MEHRRYSCFARAARQWAIVASNADRQGNVDLRIALRRGHGDCFDQCACQLVEQLGTPGVKGDNAGEFVAADPGRQGACGQDFGNPPGTLLQHIIADTVAVDVVDLLEAVEVGHQQRHTFAAQRAGRY